MFFSVLTRPKAKAVRLLGAGLLFARALSPTMWTYGATFFSVLALPLPERHGCWVRRSCPLLCCPQRRDYRALRSRPPLHCPHEVLPLGTVFFAVLARPKVVRLFGAVLLFA